MGIYLDGKRRCDNCHKVLEEGAAVSRCSGVLAPSIYHCGKSELCADCSKKHAGYCDNCHELNVEAALEEYESELREVTR